MNTEPHIKGARDATFTCGGAISMSKPDLSKVYRDYIDCLNNQDWKNLDQFVDDKVQYNGQLVGVTGYQDLLESDFRQIPDLYFDIQLIVSDGSQVASRLKFNCTPMGKFLGLDVNGKKVLFTENVFYEFRNEKIWKVWSVIDKGAIESQIQATTTESKPATSSK
jgi:predicted ester cyclase